MSHEDDVSFFRTFGIVLGVLVLLAVFFGVMANMIGGGASDDKVSNEMAQKAVAERLAPVATVAVADQASATGEAQAAPKSGADVVASSCAACHSTGVAGAPKIGDTAAWQGRYAAGIDTLMNNALNGMGAMPARGGNPALSDEEVQTAVVQMLKDSGIDTDGAAASASAPAAVAEPTTAPATAAGPDLAKGKDVYMRSCAACHGMGVAGAPKVGDAPLWSARIAQGIPALVEHANKGYAGASGFMPAKGGNMSLSDEDVAAAVAYMVSQSQ